RRILQQIDQGLETPLPRRVDETQHLAPAKGEVIRGGAERDPLQTEPRSHPGEQLQHLPREAQAGNLLSGKLGALRREPRARIAQSDPVHVEQPRPADLAALEDAFDQRLSAGNVDERRALAYAFLLHLDAERTVAHAAQ